MVDMDLLSGAATYIGMSSDIGKPICAYFETNKDKNDHKLTVSDDYEDVPIDNAMVITDEEGIITFDNVKKCFKIKSYRGRALYINIVVNISYGTGGNGQRVVRAMLKNTTLGDIRIAQSNSWVDSSSDDTRYDVVLNGLSKPFELYEDVSKMDEMIELRITAYGKTGDLIRSIKGEIRIV